MQGGAGDTYRAAECIGMRAWGGKADEIRGEDHGRVAGLLRRGGEGAAKRGPRVSGRSAHGTGGNAGALGFERLQRWGAGAFAGFLGRAGPKTARGLGRTLGYGVWAAGERGSGWAAWGVNGPPGLGWEKESGPVRGAGLRLWGFLGSFSISSPLLFLIQTNYLNSNKI